MWKTLPMPWRLIVLLIIEVDRELEFADGGTLSEPFYQRTPID